MTTANQDENWRRKFVSEVSSVDREKDAHLLLLKRRKMLSPDASLSGKGSSAQATQDPTQMGIEVATTTTLLRSKLPQIDEAAYEVIPILRERFFDLPDSELKKHLHRLAKLKYSVYSRFVKRLANVATHRHLFKSIADADPGLSDIMSEFKLIFVGNAFEANHARNAFLQRLENKPQRVKALEGIRRLQSLAPKLYQIEAEWFDNLLDQYRETNVLGRNPRVDRKTRNSILIILVALIFVGVTLLELGRTRKNIPTPKPKNSIDSFIPAGTDPKNCKDA